MINTILWCEVVDAKDEGRIDPEAAQAFHKALEAKYSNVNSHSPLQEGDVPEAFREVICAAVEEIRKRDDISEEEEEEPEEDVEGQFPCLWSNVEEALGAGRISAAEANLVRQSILDTGHKVQAFVPIPKEALTEELTTRILAQNQREMPASKPTAEQHLEKLGMGQKKKSTKPERSPAPEPEPQPRQEEEGRRSSPQKSDSKDKTSKDVNALTNTAQSLKNTAKDTVKELVKQREAVTQQLADLKQTRADFKTDIDKVGKALEARIEAEVMAKTEEERTRSASLVVRKMKDLAEVDKQLADEKHKAQRTEDARGILSSIDTRLQDFTSEAQKAIEGSKAGKLLPVLTLILFLALGAGYYFLYAEFQSLKASVDVGMGELQSTAAGKTGSVKPSDIADLKVHLDASSRSNKAYTEEVAKMMVKHFERQSALIDEANRTAKEGKASADKLLKKWTQAVNEAEQALDKNEEAGNGE